MTAAVTTDPIDLAAIWAELLDLDPATVPGDVEFLRLGGDSVLAVRMSALVRKRLGVALELADVRVGTTLDELTALVRLRRSEADAGGERALPVQVEPRPDPGATFPLLPLQQGYFVGQQDGWELSYASAHYYVDYPLTGLDPDDAPDALADALERLARRQSALRARVTDDGEQYVLPVDAPGAVPQLAVDDLRDAGTAEIERTLAQVRDRMSTNGPDPRRGPGLELRLTLLPGDRGLLHGAFSLLLFDGWSTGVLTRELIALATDWNAVLPPLEIEFGDYVDAVGRLRGSRAVAADREWWRERLTGLPAVPALPLAADPHAVRPEIMGHREARYAGERWTTLRTACTDHGVTPAAALLTAFSIVVARWAGHRHVLLNSLQAARLPLHPDVHRIVGGFASTMLLPVSLEPDLPFDELARRAQETFAEHTAHNLVSGVEVGRELARHRGTRRPVGPVVFQSTIGMDAAMGSPLPTAAGPLGTIDAGDYVHHLRTPQVALEVRCFEVADTMVVVFSLVEELFAADDVARAFAELTALVDSLADGLGWDAVPALPSAADPVDDGGTRLGLLPEPAVVHEPGPVADDVEQAVADLVEELLGVPVLDRTADFFALGGDSLLVVRAAGRIARTFGTPVAVREILADPTVAGIAAAMRS